MNKKQFKENYLHTYNAIMSGDKDKIIEQVSLIYGQKDKALDELHREIEENKAVKKHPFIA